MKKMMTLLAAILLLTLCLTGCGGNETLTLNVYNWGEYISDGSVKDSNNSLLFIQ